MIFNILLVSCETVVCSLALPVGCFVVAGMNTLTWPYIQHNTYTYTAMCVGVGVCAFPLCKCRFHDDVCLKEKECIVQKQCKAFPAAYL